jgi:hypothetical protein
MTAIYDGSGARQIAVCAGTLVLADVARAETGFEIGGVLGGVGKAKADSALPKTQQQKGHPGTAKRPINQVIRTGTAPAGPLK